MTQRYYNSPERISPDEHGLDEFECPVCHHSNRKEDDELCTECLNKWIDIKYKIRNGQILPGHIKDNMYTFIAEYDF